MSKFMFPPSRNGAANRRLSLTGRGGGGGASSGRRLCGEALQHLLHLGGERIGRGELQELLVGGEGHLGVSRGLRRLAELDLGRRVVRAQRAQLRIGSFGV